MSYVNDKSLVTTSWLADHLDDPKVKIIDGSWHLPTTGRDGHKEYLNMHIPGAVYFDIDKISNSSSKLPHMMPSSKIFSSNVSKMGISNSNKIIIYDSDGLFSAPRVWWMFRAFGHENVSVMTGGFKSWINENKPVSDHLPKISKGDFLGQLNTDMIKSLSEIKNNIVNNKELVLDARASNRFNGSEPEFRPGVRSGHIPKSLNLPYNKIINNDGTFISNQELVDVFNKLGANEEKSVITTCGSGITACILGLGLHLTGRNNWTVYDGSWTEWGSNKDVEIEV